jgi:hypothetical protein
MKTYTVYHFLGIIIVNIERSAVISFNSNKIRYRLHLAPVVVGNIDRLAKLMRGGLLSYETSEGKSIGISNVCQKGGSWMS